MKEYDVIIVGSGMVGATLACALAEKTSLSIAILEEQAAAPVWSASTYSHRVSAVALSSQRIFKHLQVWDRIQSKRVSPYTKMEVWDALHLGKIQFDGKEIGEPVLGYIVENNVIQAALVEKVKQYAQIDVIAPVHLAAFTQDDCGVELTSTDQRVFKAKLAVAADGAHSWLREKAGITVERNDYDQEAIVATVQTEFAHESTARQVFLATGPLAFLPLAESCLSSIVWSVPKEGANRLMALDVDAFKEELTRAFTYRLGKVVDVDQRFSFPLRKQQANQYVQSRVVLVGDSAHTVHPLAGQGVNIGLLDAASLAEIISEAIERDQDFCSKTWLRRYERWRRADNVAMLQGVDLIKKLFASDVKVMQALRSHGLDMTNKLSWVKNKFTRHAVGNRDGLPEMAKSRPLNIDHAQY